MLPAVVDGDRQADHVRQDHRSPRPGLDRPLVVRRHRGLHLLHEMKVDERSFSQRSWHLASPALISCRAGARSCRRCACSRASCSPWSACPTAIPDGGRRTSCLRRHRAGGRPGSSRHRAPSGARRASASRRPCRASAGCARSCRPRRASRGNPISTLRISPERSRRVAYAPSRATSCAEQPALRAICAPLPGFNSMQWTTLPSGMLRSGSVLPGSIGAVAPRHQLVARVDATRRDDVAALAIAILQQRDVRGAVRVVFEPLDRQPECRPCRA